MKLMEAVSQAIIPAKLREDVSPEGWGYGVDPDDDSYLYRSLSSGPRDLSQLKREKAANVSYYLWLTNPYAKRGLDIIADFIIGGGITCEAQDSKIQWLWEQFWFGKPWSFETRLSDYIDMLNLFGELPIPFTVNTQNGQLTYSIIDPLKIQKVNFNPDNYLEMKSIELKKGTGAETTTLLIVNDAEKALKENVTTGVFFWQINKIINAERGNGCLNATIDILSSLDDFLFAELERAMLLRNFVWDVTLEGEKQEGIKDFLKSEEAAPPKPGSLRAHNEKVVWNAVSPDLKASDTSSLFNILFNTVAVGLGIPEHWIVTYGADLSRAVGREMNEPVFKRLEHKQKYVKAMFELMFDFEIANAVKYGRETQAIDPKTSKVIGGKIDKSTDKTYVLKFPEVSPKNLNELSDILQKLVTSLGLARMNDWVSDAACSNIIQGFVESEMGIEIPDDARVGIEDIEQSKENRRQKEQEEMERRYEMAMANAKQVNNE